MGKGKGKDSLPGATSNSRIINNFMMDWRNRSLLKKINDAKATVSSKPVVYVKSSRNSKHISQQEEIDQSNSILAQKLSDIYNRNSQY